LWIALIFRMYSSQIDKAYTAIEKQMDAFEGGMGSMAYFCLYDTEHGLQGKKVKPARCDGRRV